MVAYKNGVVTGCNGDLERGELLIVIARVRGTHSKINAAENKLLNSGDFESSPRSGEAIISCDIDDDKAVIF